MKVYVLTHCAAEENYTPLVCTKKSDAQNALKEVYDANINNEDYMACIEDITLYDDSLTIIYKDDTYDIYQLFEVEVE